ncbi:glycosyl transferase, group 2 family protein [[Synechococcus] sp. NIES-970]|uniref:TIGR04283 family arsenosugar biosynthesis glycosyltransferase n=1 Tax=Picosynechococcus sp. NKBG15041c TaxID=1407650 RepID=UPI00041C77EF|nr:TIGR04283 family arsenosugar biosynthesis glycosyltransferase [Picosynechococcus sp. NKBG15041c]BAW97471.1 glycosyl transferase, group 2 family protein [[Synechococcus] sp. NIES-970]
MSISVIIPVLNEAAGITQCLGQLLPYQGTVEIIVVDGGSQDNTCDLVRQFPVILQETNGGRGKQMNQGAAIASGEILLFLHSDTQLPTGFPALVQTTLADAQVIAGAFPLAIADARWSLRLVEKMVQWRSQIFSLPYGDQGIFLRRRDFERLGGYAELAIMEDYEFLQRLKKQGQIRLTEHPVLTSSRRWQKLGVWRTTWINQKVILGYHLGVDAEVLRQWYQRQMTPST